ncbi:MAG: hypothetical protein NC218_07845 [Acetobacter sp.]|nr:hypothetical protein [Acetobacter sp.]
MKILTGEGVELSEEQRGKVTEGVDWLKSWLTNRYENGHFIDRIDSDRSDAELEVDSAAGALKYKETMATLDEVSVCVCKDEQAVEDYIKKGIREGKLHLVNGLDEYGGDANRAAEEYKLEVNTGGGFMGVRCYSLVEPIVFVTEKAVDQGFTASVTAHETTHLIELKDSEAKAAPGVFTEGPGLFYETASGAVLMNPDMEADTYWDSGLEIYARLMQMRKDLGLKPDEVYTPEDVAKLREDCAKRTADYKLKLGLDVDKLYSGEEIQAAQKLHPEAGEKPTEIDYNMFSRYTDEQISFLLNETADIGKPRENETPERMDVRVAMQESALMANVNFEVFQEAENQRLANKQREVVQENEAPTKKTELTPAMIMRLRSGNQYT